MIETDILLKAYRLMCAARAMAKQYEANSETSKYIYSTSQGYEALQLATAFQLLPCDYVSTYYHDDCLLLGLGFTPYQLMLQMQGKRDNNFSGGGESYSHPDYRGDDKPIIMHHSSAIPATGVAHGIQFLENSKSHLYHNGQDGESPVVICSLANDSVAEEELSAAFQFAVLKELPIIYVVQDNNSGISDSADKSRTRSAYRFAKGFKELERIKVDGSSFSESFRIMKKVVHEVRTKRNPWLMYVSVPLPAHHKSEGSKQIYTTAEDHADVSKDSLVRLRTKLLITNLPEEQLTEIEKNATDEVDRQFAEAANAPKPDAVSLSDFIFMPAPVIHEQGERGPASNKKISMLDAVLVSLQEILEEHPEAIIYGQETDRNLGGFFSEAIILAKQFGDERVFNTAVNGAYMIGSTVGLSATGVKPIVEIAGNVFSGLNQLITQVAPSCYLTSGKFPVQTLIRMPVGAYDGSTPYQSATIESILLNVKGIKVVYPSNAADMKGLMKTAFLDPNPVVMLEHKGLYHGNITDTEGTITIEPGSDYVLPLGIGNVVLPANDDEVTLGNTCCVITYGMGVYRAKAAAKNFPGQVEIIDLRTLIPLDEELIFLTVKKHGKCLVLTEEAQTNSFAEALAARINKECFTLLDAPVEVLGVLNLPAVSINILEHAMAPDSLEVAQAIKNLLAY